MIIPNFDVAGDVRIRVHHFTPNAAPIDPIVVMCHPTGFCGLAFASVVAHLRKVNVYAIDIRSHGYSQRGDVRAWNLFAQDLDRVFQEIRRQNNNRCVIGVGISSGSSAHILNASKNKEFYSGLFLCEPIMFAPESNIDHREALAQSARRRRDSFESFDEAYFKYSSRGPLSNLSPSTLALYVNHGFKQVGDQIQLRCHKQDEEAIYLSGTANGVFEALSTIEVPTTIVYGEHSTTMTKELANKFSNQMINGRSQVLPGTGHFTLFERPYLGAAQISKFINNLDSLIQE